MDSTQLLNASSSVRLDRFICKSTRYTREEALALILSGQVLVNDTVIRHAGQQVHENNLITLYGQRLVARPFRYLMLHKPAGTICASRDEFYPSLFNLLNVQGRGELHVAGRLDADTTGLVLLTDDGRWSFHLTSPNSRCEKRYRVRLRDPLTEEAEERFARGIELQGEKRPTLPARVQRLDSCEVLLTISEGRFHQVKRMFAALGNRVVGLHRESIGGVELNVELGRWRHLSEAEVALLGKYV